MIFLNSAITSQNLSNVFLKEKQNKTRQDLLLFEKRKRLRETNETIYTIETCFSAWFAFKTNETLALQFVAKWYLSTWPLTAKGLLALSLLPSLAFQKQKTRVLRVYQHGHWNTYPSFFNQKYPASNSDNFTIRKVMGLGRLYAEHLIFKSVHKRFYTYFLQLPQPEVLNLKSLTFLFLSIQTS